MMKRVFSLVVLLHLCNTMPVDFNLNNEIIDSLLNLTKLHEEKRINISSPDTVRVPSDRMCSHSACCVEVFKTELQTLLRDHVKVVNDNDTDPMDTLEELEGNLEALQVNKTPCHLCHMTNKHLPSAVFNQYAHFLQKLNNR